ncbi:hypothetical protein P7L74_16830 [Tistrella mobilis]|uniref:hypothetical protein n=1 Tax=Tistrella mobilis TaxID=171437 RepID=UPI0035584C61
MTATATDCQEPHRPAAPDMTAVTGTISSFRSIGVRNVGRRVGTSLAEAAEDARGEINLWYAFRRKFMIAERV